MAQRGYTPLLSYGSTTATNVPLAADLTTSASGVELAVNAADGKLFYKDSAGVVQVLASKAGNVNVASFQTSLGGLTPSTATTGIVTLAGTLNTSSGGTGLTSYTAGDLPYYASGTALSKLAIGTSGQILISSGTAPQWSTLSGVAVTTFSAGTTGFTPNSATSGAITLAGTLATTSGGTGLTSFTANQVFYASSTSAFAQSSNLQFSGTDLTVYGLTVGRGAGAVSTNTAMGASALQANSTGARVTAVGNQAGFSNTADNNSFFGSSAGYSNTTGANNFFGGQTSGYSNTSGASNTALGKDALFSNTTASNNTAVGYRAGYANTTGTFNCFVGDSAGQSVTTGQANTIIGSYSGNQGGLDIRTASNYCVISDGDGNPRFVVDSSGSASIGTASIGGGITSGWCFLKNWYGAGDDALIIGHAGAASGDPYMSFNYNGTAIGSITQAGTTGVLYNVTSDYRLKTVIGPVENAGQRIDALQPIEYIWNADGSRTRGFLAHQFQEVYAGSVSGTKDAVDVDGKPVYQAMQASSSEVIADLVAEIQSLRKRLAALEAK